MYMQRQFVQKELEYPADITTSLISFERYHQQELMEEFIDFKNRAAPGKKPGETLTLCDFIYDGDRRENGLYFIG